MARYKAELEEKYQAVVADKAVFDVWQADQNWQTCQKCQDVICVKGDDADHHTLSSVIVVNGQLQVRKERCPQWSAYINRKSARAGIPARYIGKTLLDYKSMPENAEAISMASWYAEKCPRKWLYFYGGVGTGKTLLAAIIARRFIENGKRVIFGNVPTLLKRIKERFDIENRKEQDDNITAAMIMEKYIKVPLLVLDDLGAGYLTPWSIGVLFEIISERYNAGLRTIITSNYDPDQLAQRLRVKGATIEGEQIVSRIMEMSEEAFFGTVDKRRLAR